MGFWRLGKYEIPPWKLIAGRGKWLPALETGCPLWDIISYRCPPFAQPHPSDPICIFRSPGERGNCDEGELGSYQIMHWGKQGMGMHYGWGLGNT